MTEYQIRLEPSGPEAVVRMKLDAAADLLGMNCGPVEIVPAGKVPSGVVQAIGNPPEKKILHCPSVDGDKWVTTEVQAANGVVTIGETRPSAVEPCVNLLGGKPWTKGHWYRSGGLQGWETDSMPLADYWAGIACAAVWLASTGACLWYFVPGWIGALSVDHQARGIVYLVIAAGFVLPTVKFGLRCSELSSKAMPGSEGKFGASMVSGITAACFAIQGIYNLVGSFPLACLLDV